MRDARYEQPAKNTWAPHSIPPLRPDVGAPVFAKMVESDILWAYRDTLLAPRVTADTGDLRAAVYLSGLLFQRSRLGLFRCAIAGFALIRMHRNTPSYGDMRPALAATEHHAGIDGGGGHRGLRLISACT